MSAPDRRRLVGVLVRLASAASCVVIGFPVTVASEQVDAVWKEQRMTLEYRSTGPLHTCAGLHSQLRSLLRTLGVREDMTISVTRCEALGAEWKVSLALASPVEATEKNLSDLAAGVANRELIARVRGTLHETPTSPAPFPAEWRTISFANALHLRLTPADCELLKQLRRELFPKLAVRVVSDRVRCASDLASGYRPQLVITALVASEASTAPN